MAVIAGSTAPGPLSAQTAPTASVSAPSIEVQRGREAEDRKDYAAALKWFQKGADQGNAIAQFNIGCMYREGWGVTQDYAQALIWFQKAAAQGNAPAQDNIGLMYHDGMGVKQDYAAAMAWSLKAAAQGSVAARLRISVMYMKGEGVQKDMPTAMAWLHRAAEATDPAPIEASNDKPDIMLMCDMKTGFGKIVKAVVSIDTTSKDIKFEVEGQGTIEYRDGTYGKAITSGYMADEAVKVHQYVMIDDDHITFGFKNNGVVDENTIDRRTGLMTSSGQITQCTPLPTKRQF